MYKVFTKNGFLYSFSFNSLGYRFSILPSIQLSFMSESLFKIEISLFSLFFEFSRTRISNREDVKNMIEALLKMVNYEIKDHE